VGLKFFFPLLAARAHSNIRALLLLFLVLLMRLQKTLGKKTIDHFPRTTPATSSRIEKTALLLELRMRDDFPDWWESRQLVTCNTDAARIAHRVVIR
jgi:hypothetical protein